MENKNIDVTALIQAEVNRISTKYNKDFLECEDLMQIMIVGRNNICQLARNASFPTTNISNRKVVSVLNFVTWMTLYNNTSEVQNV